MRMEDAELLLNVRKHNVTYCTFRCCCASFLLPASCRHDSLTGMTLAGECRQQGRLLLVLHDTTPSHLPAPRACPSGRPTPEHQWLCPACSESSRRQYPSRSRRQSNGSTGRTGKKTPSGLPGANGAAEVDKSASGSTKAAKGGGAVVVVANGITEGRPAAVPSGKGGRKVSTAATAVGDKETAISSDATPGLSNGLASTVVEREVFWCAVSWCSAFLAHRLPCCVVSDQR